MFFLIISCCLYASYSPNSTICPYDQAAALLQLKQEFTAPYLHSWKEGSNCCNWEGVKCDEKNGQVIGLYRLWLFGPLSSNSSLFSLRHLQELDLAYSDFMCSKIPSEFGQLVKLTHLDLSDSFLSGEIPLEFHFVSLRK